MNAIELDTENVAKMEVLDTEFARYCNGKAKHEDFFITADMLAHWRELANKHFPDAGKDFINGKKLEMLEKDYAAYCAGIEDDELCVEWNKLSTLIMLFEAYFPEPEPGIDVHHFSGLFDKYSPAVDQNMNAADANAKMELLNAEYADYCADMANDDDCLSGLNKLLHLHRLYVEYFPGADKDAENAGKLALLEKEYADYCAGVDRDGEFCFEWNQLATLILLFEKYFPNPKSVAHQMSAIFLKYWKDADGEGVVHV